MTKPAKTDSGNVAKKALTVAIRYAAIRRQFGSKPTEPETKILDYVIHQYRLMPLLAQAVCIAIMRTFPTPALTSVMTVRNALHGSGGEQNL